MITQLKGTRLAPSFLRKTLRKTNQRRHCVSSVMRNQRSPTSRSQCDCIVRFIRFTQNKAQTIQNNYAHRWHARNPGKGYVFGKGHFPDPKLRGFWCVLHTTYFAFYVCDRTRLHTLCPIYVLGSFSLRTVILFDKYDYAIKRYTPCAFFPSKDVT